ncbi:MAG: MBOAT family protein, partial [Lachnospira sp.]|nr:MBOAT family protein [Lachnospira sp.]
MSFLKVSFFLFLIVGAIIYYIIPKKLQWVWLLILSFIYYFSFSIPCSLALVYVTTIIYVAGRFITKLENDRKAAIKPEGVKLSKDEKKIIKEKYTRKKKMVVAIALVFAFGLLAVIKYSDFAVTNFNRVFGSTYKSPSFVLPLGLSFFTFQAVSYVIDVYQGKCSAETNYFKMLLFVSFFPQIMQG